MSNVPEDLKYTKDHEWLKLNDDGTATIGITDYAQESLGDITFVELPEVDAEFSQGDSFGVVESVKAASDLYMPVSGKVVEVNEELEDEPEEVNSDPYGKGWIARLELADKGQLDGLMDAAAYNDILE